MKNALLLLSTALCFWIAHPAHAMHPLISDDAATQGQGHWQFEGNTDFLHPWAQAGSSVAGMTLSYGAADRLDLTLTQAVFRQPSAAVGDTVLGMKWRIAETDGRHLGIKAELLLPTGNDAKGFGYGRANAALTGLWVEFEGNWTWLGNIALASNSFRDEASRAANRSWLWRASSAVLYRVGEKWRVALDAGIRRNAAAQDNRVPAYMLAGLIYMPTEHIDLDIGAKFGLNRAEVQRQLGAGLTVRF